MYYSDYDFGMNLSDIKESVYIPLAPGEYKVQAEQVEFKNTKMGNGKYLQFEFSVEDSPLMKRKIFQNVMVEHPNEDAKRIGLEWLKSWILACNGSESERLNLSLIYRHLRQPCIATVDVEVGKMGYQDKNKILRFKKLNNNDNSEGMPF